MRNNVPDHPDVAAMLLTGYPSYIQQDSVHCCECGKPLDDETIYEDRYHEYLCLDCLKVLHEKW